MPLFQDLLLPQEKNTDHPGAVLWQAEPKGCAALKNKLDCLSSVDGSDVTSFAGIKIKGAPGKS